MYLWKCWRDTRKAFLGFIGALLVLGAFGAYVQFDPFSWLAAKPESSRELWQITAEAMVNTLAEAVPAAGFFLGALGVGLEFENRTADFLLTRPRSRRFFLWTSWGVGAAQMIALVLVSVAVIRLTRFSSSPTVTARLFVAICVVTLIIYAVTYLTTTLARNSRHGIGLALAALSAYEGLIAWLHVWYGIAFPVPWDLAFRLSDGAAPLFSITDMIGWLAVCLALGLVAQFSLERAEI